MEMSPPVESEGSVIKMLRELEAKHPGSPFEASTNILRKPVVPVPSTFNREPSSEVVATGSPKALILKLNSFPSGSVK